MNTLLKKSANTSLLLIIAFNRKHVGQKYKMYLKEEIPNYVSRDFELHSSLGKRLISSFSLRILFVLCDQGVCQYSNSASQDLSIDI